VTCHDRITMNTQNLLNFEKPRNLNRIDASGQVERFVIRRYFAMANKWTFQIPPIKELLERYVGNGKGWVDPYAGENSMAEYTNDHNPERKTKYHLDAKEFCEKLEGKFDGILFDPPYSYRQITEHYKVMGLKANRLDTSYNFYRRVMNVIIPKLKVGSYAISFGWNSNGFGKKYGFEIIEILLVAHGGHHNDTIVTVERKAV
jgi:hypothetical protein